MDWDAKVKHHERERRFEIEHDGHRSVAEYELGNGVVSFTHTFVPPELRGQGVAAALARASLAWARVQKLKVRPSCSYFARYMQSHPETQDLWIVSK